MRAKGCGASALPVPIVSVGSTASVRFRTRLAVQGGRQAKAANDCVTGDRRLPSEADAAQRFGDVHGLSGFVACSAVELTLGGVIIRSGNAETALGRRSRNSRSSL